MTTNVTTLGAALFTASTAHDRSGAKVRASLSPWAIAIATEMQAKRMDEAALAAHMVATATAGMSAKRAAAIKSVSDVQKKVSATFAGHFYSMRRVARAGRLQAVIDGGALSTVMAETPSTQAPSSRKSTSKGKSGGTNQNGSADNDNRTTTVVLTPPLSFAAAAKAVIEAASRADVASIAKSDQLLLSKAQAALAKLAGQVEAHIKATAAAKPAKRQRKARAA